jgi:adenylate cyclase class 2
MQNIEIKARYVDSNKARVIAQKFSAQHVGTDHQVDTYFTTPKGRLKLRESSLSGAMLIPYNRPNTVGPKKSEYQLLPVQDANLSKRLFSEILGVDTVVDKIRDIFLIGNVRVHVDVVKDLGCFLEFEAVYADTKQEGEERKKVENLIAQFEIKPDQLLSGSYREMMASEKKLR